MTRLRPLPSRKVIKILEKLGFQRVRQKGSHLFLRHPDGRTTLVPIHRGDELGPGLLKEIIKDCKLTREEFLSLFD
ncbi:MAG: type II toxin-antitoxin system HicA family toxin [Theionarchaea archaeon]|nr:type II toxin-antitoxin system HicA family toxin [Theionarchaea archaeon]